MSRIDAMILRSKITFSPKLTPNKLEKIEDNVPLKAFVIDGNRLCYNLTFDWKNWEPLYEELDRLRDYCYHHIKTRMKGKILAMTRVDSKEPSQNVITFNKETIDQSFSADPQFHWVQVYIK